MEIKRLFLWIINTSVCFAIVITKGFIDLKSTSGLFIFVIGTTSLNYILTELFFKKRRKVKRK